MLCIVTSALSASDQFSQGLETCQEGRRERISYLLDLDMENFAPLSDT